MKLARRETGLLKVEEARQALTRAKTVPETMEVVAKLDGLAAFFRARRDTWGQALDAEELALQGHVQSGDKLEELRRRKLLGRGRNKQKGRPVPFQLRNLLQVPDDEARQLAKRQAKALAIWTDDKARWEDYVRTQRKSLGAITLSGLVDAKSVAFSSASNEWYTPKDYVDAARRVLGTIDLDPASCAKANATVGAERYFTEKDDGLSQPWLGRIWLNPPYGKKEGESSAGVWAARLAEQYHAGNTKAAVLLVNASTEQKWFQPLLAEFPCCLTDHRIAFAVAGEEEPKSPISGNAFFYLGSDAKRFADEFAVFGAIVQPFNGNKA